MSKKRCPQCGELVDVVTPTPDPVTPNDSTQFAPFYATHLMSWGAECAGSLTAVAPVGKKLIDGLKEMLADMESGKAVRQRTVRRMKVKGETVYVHDEFTAPIGKKGRL